MRAKHTVGRKAKMTQPIAGWYTDPAGDTTKLRYWDGTKWTDSLMDAPAPEPQAAPATETQPAAPAASVSEAQAAPQEAPATEAQAAPQPAAQAAPQPAPQPAAQAAAQPAPQPAPQPTAAYDAAYQQPAEQPIYSDPNTTAIYVNYADAPLYYVSPQDTTLRLVAFILALISTITMGFAVIPLAWMIPMTVMTWQIYKGKRANTVGFDVCSLIFLNLVSGILLLVSTKEE